MIEDIIDEDGRIEKCFYCTYDPENNQKCEKYQPIKFKIEEIDGR